PAGAAGALRIAHAERLTHECARGRGETDAREEGERLDLPDDLVRRDIFGAEAEHQTRQEEDAEAERRALESRREADGEERAGRRQRASPTARRVRRSPCRLSRL